MFIQEWGWIWVVIISNESNQTIKLKGNGLNVLKVAEPKVYLMRLDS